jgi:hypothetical protein
MKLEIRDDVNLDTSDQEPGSYFNLGKSPVLLRVPEMAELRLLWKAFEADLRSEIKELLLTPYGQVVERLGRLGFRSSEAAARADVLFGMLTSGSPAKSSHFRKKAMAEAAIALELLPDQTVHGRQRKRAKRGEGSIEDYALAMSKDQQRRLIEAIVDIEDLDAWLMVSQGSTVGWKDLRTSLQQGTDPMAFLSELASMVDQLLGDNDALVKRHSGEDKITFAPSWFGQFLARKGVWAWPARYVARIVYLYPSRFMPLVARMSVEKSCRDFADKVFRYHQDQRNTGAVQSLQVFAIAGLGGNAWEDGGSGFRWYPLASLKSAGREEFAPTISVSANTIYKIAVDQFGHELLERPEAKLFLHSLRLRTTGVDAFNWTIRPTAFNTQVASRLLGKPVAAVPAHVRSWAAQLRELLPLFQVKGIDQVENALNLWLIFLMTVDPKDAPTDFQAVSRMKHIHDVRRVHLRTFREFLAERVPEDSRDMRNKALSCFQKAFYLASVRDGFQHVGNPVELAVDKFSRKNVKRPDVTPRKPLEMEAWELIVRKNREGDYNFARSLGPKQYHYTLRNPETGDYDHVFWPAEAIIVDIILNSGMRHISARWADSGEGDERILDTAILDTVLNSHPAATLGRNEGFLQLVTLPGREKQHLVGMNVGINKTGKPFVIPWTDPAIVEAVERMKALQAKYNPINAPVKAMESGVREFTRAAEDLFPDIFPLFRDPGRGSKLAVSSAKVLLYWKKLLRECQPAVNELFGHEYPLIEDDGMVFDLHALRVTMVSNLLAAGVSLEVVRDLVGHATWVMTWHYNGRRSAMLHSAVQEVMTQRTEAHDIMASGDREGILEYAQDAIIPDFVDDHVGKQMLTQYAERRGLSPFSVFVHGICPGGQCSTGGERISEGKYKPVWRERACALCRYRVTGPKFLPGILNHLNNLMAEMRLSAKRAKELGDRIEGIEAESGKPAHALRRAQKAESSFRDSLSKEYAAETKVLEIVRQVRSTAASKGDSADRILLPSVPDFDISQLEYGFAEAHEFELMHMLVKETRILPASIMEIPHGVEENLKAVVRQILRANDMSEIVYRMAPSQEKEICIRIGDALLQEYPEPSRFQQLVEGAVRLDVKVLDSIRNEVDGLLSSSSKPLLIESAA